MLRTLHLLSVSLVAAGFLMVAPVSAEPQFSRAPGEFTPINDNNNDRVCCHRGNSDWWSARQACTWAGGHATDNRQCRNDDRWDGDGRNDGRWNGDDRYEGRWNERTCCRRDERQGYRIFWSTVGECRRTGGEGATNKTCRKYGGFHRYPGQGNGWGNGWGDGWDQGQNPNERVCCIRNGQAWWSNRAECARSSGHATANSVCRR